VEIPKEVGPFELRRTIGHGTYGDVFEAFDAEREIHAAVKVFGRAPKGKAAFARLRRDALAAGALGHPNIAMVIAAGQHEDLPWVATELVAGVNLAQVVRSHAFWPIEKVLDVWRQLCEGLAHAHREGLLHLDLKPSDIRVNADGDIKVVDFGAWHLKTIERRKPRSSDEGLHYRPAEVIAGRRPDRRADIFAVGAIVYELMTRRKAFPGESPTEVMRSLSRGEPDLTSVTSSAFSPGFEKILGACLEREVSARPASFEDVHADLVQLVRDTAPRLREPEPSPEPLPEPVPEREEYLEELTRARAEDRLEDALDVCRKLRALDPEDERARRAFSEIEFVMLGREADELVGEALAHAADGDFDRATRLAEKVERLAPWSPGISSCRSTWTRKEPVVQRIAWSRPPGSARKRGGRRRPERRFKGRSRRCQDTPSPSGCCRSSASPPEVAASPEEGSDDPDRPGGDESRQPRTEAEALTADASRHFTASEHD